jgi:uncharacterized protein YlxW (UPF0749 family)
MQTQMEAKSPRPTGSRVLRRQAPLFLLCLLLGFGLVLQFRTQAAIQQHRTAPADQVTTVGALLRSIATLREELADLQREPASAGPDTGESAEQIQTLLQELATLRAFNGGVELLGPGVEVQIAMPIAPQDLHDLLNDLRGAGAEAMALNDHRLVASSAITGSDDELRLNGTPLSRPYNIRAIGAATALERALTRPGGMVAVLQQNYPGARITVVRRDRLHLPAAGDPPAWRYARPAG